MKVAVSCSKEHAAALLKRYHVVEATVGLEQGTTIITTWLAPTPGQPSLLFAQLEKEKLDYQCIER